MADTFKALVVEKADDRQTTNLRTLSDADLPDGDVTVRIAYSTVNYKDGLALTGASPIIRSFPMVPGIDLAGTVEASDHRDFKPGDLVLVNGYGLSERYWGGYAQKARLKAEWLVPVPAAFTPRQAMAIGTAGYTAMLSVMALEAHAITPDSGDILVTGASGGVGGVAIALLARLGYRVVASTGRLDQADYLKGLGAAEVIDRAELSGPAKPLGRETWAGAIDSVGSHTLANVLSRMKYDGCVAACGLAQGPDLPASVMPFILRGVVLAGIDSVMLPMPKRRAAWTRLASDIDGAMLDRLVSDTIPLASVPQAAEQIMAGQVRGRVIVDVNA